MDLVTYITEMAVTVGALVPFVNIVVKASEGIGLSGKFQLIFALIFGGAVNAFAFIAFHGVPVDVQGWFFFLLQVLAGAGAPVGFYEAVLNQKKE